SSSPPFLPVGADAEGAGCADGTAPRPSSLLPPERNRKYAAAPSTSTPTTPARISRTFRLPPGPFCESGAKFSTGLSCRVSDMTLLVLCNQSWSAAAWSVVGGRGGGVGCSGCPWCDRCHRATGALGPVRGVRHRLGVGEQEHP